MTLFIVFVTIVILFCIFFWICKENNVSLSISNIYDDERPIIIIIFVMIYKTDKTENFILVVTLGLIVLTRLKITYGPTKISKQ